LGGRPSPQSHKICQIYSIDFLSLSLSLSLPPPPNFTPQTLRFTFTFLSFANSIIVSFFAGIETAVRNRERNKGWWYCCWLGTFVNSHTPCVASTSTAAIVCAL
ncbi:hypothetical protein V8G54_033942, partial [Vigna mungo]